jgi:hypothetical protein
MLQRWQSTATGTATRRSDANTTSEPDAPAHLHIKVNTATGDNEDIKPLRMGLCSTPLGPSLCAFP